MQCAILKWSASLACEGRTCCAGNGGMVGDDSGYGQKVELLPAAETKKNTPARDISDHRFLKALPARSNLWPTSLPVERRRAGTRVGALMTQTPTGVGMLRRSTSIINGGWDLTPSRHDHASRRFEVDRRFDAHLVKMLPTLGRVALIWPTRA